MRLVSGAAIWRLHAQDGFPVELSLMLLSEHGAVPTWDDLLSAAQKDGANVAALLRRLDAAVGDAYSPEDATAIRAGLAKLSP